VVTLPKTNLNSMGINKYNPEISTHPV